MKPQAAARSTTGVIVLEESYRRTLTTLGHLLEDLLKAATVLVALAEVVLWWLVATPAVEAVSHPILQGKPNASHMCARINLHTHDRQTNVIPLQ
jgi:hypothetical protein